MEPKLTGDEIVISGIAGRFPNSDNVKELQNNFFNKMDCVSDNNTRWNFEHCQIPSRIGIINNIDKFDCVFFGVHKNLSEFMDPMTRLLLEISYEAIIDAGINPRKLRGSKSSIFTGSSFSESEIQNFSDKFEKRSLVLLGGSRSMLANRLSFFLGLNGPSVNIDFSCCGSAAALEEGFREIKEGRAESAIIGGSNIVLHPNMSLQLFQLGLLSPDGTTKSFDNAANGYTRSEATVVLFLQKARDAKRIYAEVKNVRSCFGNVNNDQSFFYSTQDTQANLMRMTLSECGLSGKDISFVEADGSGIKDVDAAEVEAIDKVYNDGRKSPLPIGSVKSNLGSCSAVNPLNGIIKVITAMESGYIPPNLHFQKSSDKIPALNEGRCKVVTELTPWTGNYAIVNSLGLTGACANIILKDYKKEKINSGKPDDNLPRLVTVSGCTEEALDVILSDLESRPVDVEMLQLMYDIYESDIPAHLYRGYTLLPSCGLNNNKTREIQFNTGFKREIWYMFSGMGSQWTGMGETLLQIPVFAAAINKCDQVLKPRGIDIVHIITKMDPKIFENIVNSFVGIAAVQIGLVDVLSAIGLKPDYLIGHSVGELGCAYADGCFTAEQMILSALSRGLASIETEMPKGSMAAVGLGYEELTNLCPPDIDIACHNSADSYTISGPSDSIKTFVAHLQANNIFAKEVACSNIAYHSRYIAPASEKLKKYLQEVIPDPKPRSKRWISSSIPRNEWKTARARLSSAEYHTNNLLSSVFFAEAAKSIPANATVIEIAPHGLLQAIVRKSLPENVLNVPLTKRGHPDNVSFFFTSLGKLYNAGHNFKVSNLYPKVNYPVSRGTPSISSLIRWDHSNNLKTNFFKQPDECKKGEMNFIINLNEEKWKYLKHAKIDGKVVLPTSLYLKTVWDVLKFLKDDFHISVVFENVLIHKHQVEIPGDDDIVLVAMIQKGSGYFEVTNNKILLCSGSIQATDTPHEEYSNISEKYDKDNQELSESEIYTELQMRGLQYSGPFRTIYKSSANGSNGTLVWKDNWITFLEGMIQMNFFGNDVRNPQVPVKIRKIAINLKLHEEIINSSNEVPASVYKKLGSISAGGIQIEGIVLKSILHEFWKNNVVTEQIQVVPNISNLITFKHSPLFPNLQQVSNWKAVQLITSKLDSISWVEEFSNLDANTIKIEYSAINEADILSATTQIAIENMGTNRQGMQSLGQEYSGFDSTGNKVMGISANSTFSNYTTPDPVLTWRIPDNWKLEDAATVPLAYTVAFLASVMKGKVHNKESIFVYNGCCSIGQAIINIALNYEVQVFVGHTSNKDKNFLQKNYSNIPENHFIQTTKHIRDQLSLIKTVANGVDLVIYNATNISNFESCLTYLKRGATIILIANLQNAITKSMGMEVFEAGNEMFSVIPKNVVNLDLDTKNKLSEMIESGIKSGIVKPLLKQIYSREMLKNAFMAGAAKNVFEKIIVKVQSEDGNSRALAMPRFLCKTEGSYLLIEGLSDFGLKLVEFLVIRGARNIVIVSESRNTRAYSKNRIGLWREYGVSVIVYEEFYLSHQQNINALLEEISSLGTIDAIFDLQRIDNLLTKSSSSKYLFTKHLFEESEQMFPDLRQLIVFLTCENIDQNFDDLLLREIDLTNICQEKSNQALRRRLVLLGPVTELLESTTEIETNVPLLSISTIMEQMDNLMRSEGLIVSVSSKSLEANSKKIVKEFDTVKQTERSKFEKYINTSEPVTMISRV